jgi:predicted aspartyl protease
MHPCRRFLLAVIAQLVFSIAAYPQETSSLPFRTTGGRIIVQGTIGEIERLNILLDTGSTCSVISPKLVKRLQLRTLPITTVLASNGRPVRYPLVYVPCIEIGPVRRPLTCPMAELPVAGIDILIGMDFLSRVAFTADFAEQLLHFGFADSLLHHVAFDPSRKEIIVTLRIGGREIPVLLDSGADTLYLFGERVRDLLKQNSNPDRRVRHLSNEGRGTTVRLSDVALGDATFEAMQATVLEPAQSDCLPQWHGLLGLRSLRSKRVCFDFVNGLLSWD